MLGRKRLRLAYVAAKVPRSSGGSGDRGRTIGNSGSKLDAETSTNLDSVTLAIAPTAARDVKVQLTSGGSWCARRSSSGSVTCNTTSPRASVAGAAALTVA